jgi:hypothetical protein
MSYHIYCLNFGDKRTAAITASFAAVGLSDKVTLCPGVSAEVIKEANNHKPEYFNYYYTICSIFLGHISMMKMFLETSDKEFGIFCENDIRIHKDIKSKIPYYLEKMKDLNLDILRLGYFIRNQTYLDSLKRIKEGIYEKTNLGIPGAQMYVLTRQKCQKHVEKFNLQYLLHFFYGPKVYYYVDGNVTLVDDGKSALIYPMLALEYIPDNWNSEHGDDTEYQRDSCKFNLTGDYL